MSTVQDYSIDTSRDGTRQSNEETGTPPQALISPASPDIQWWKQAIDQMLSWKTSSGHLESEDQPDDEILSTAIDYAVDQVETKTDQPAPNSVIPSGSGRIAMEWNDGLRTVVVEFIALGIATYTEFDRNKLVRSHKLVRNPKSRHLESRG